MLEIQKKTYHISFSESLEIGMKISKAWFGDVFLIFANGGFFFFFLNFHLNFKWFVLGIFFLFFYLGFFFFFFCEKCD